MIKTYTRRNGTRFEMTLTVDVDKIADDMAQKLARSGNKRASKCSGGVVATIREL
jgi:hypothetical protein